MGEQQPVVVIHYDTDRNVSYLITEGVTVLTVDERCRTDRVYRSHPNALHGEIAELVGNSIVGDTGDDTQQLLREIAGIDTAQGAN